MITDNSIVNPALVLSHLLSKEKSDLPVYIVGSPALQVQKCCFYFYKSGVLKYCLYIFNISTGNVPSKFFFQKMVSKVRNKKREGINQQIAV